MDIQDEWEKLDSEKDAIVTRCEQYAKWTLPAVCPEETEETSEVARSNVAIGAKLVNHLSNRIVDTMFPSDRPFFTLPITPKAERQLREELGQEFDKAIKQVKQATTAIESDAMRQFNITEYRPVAVMAVKHMIVTGNAIIHRTDSNKRVVYGIKDSCVVRKLDGDLSKVILRDKKYVKNLPKPIRDILEDADVAYKEDDTECTIFTRYEYKDNRWHRKQAVDKIDITSSAKSYKEVDFPCLSLVWDLHRGENYGRGLVEDHSVLFHNIDMHSESLIDLGAVVGDIKFLVNPAAVTDAEEYNNAPRGAYLPGKEGDIFMPNLIDINKLQILSETIKGWERELSTAFLLSSSGVRDAERVTAEEIRFYARELESAFGGLYGKLAIGWQKKEADYLVSKLDFSRMSGTGVETFDLVVTTGLESLSREGQLDSLRLAVADLQMLEAVPESIRAIINPIEFASFVFSKRNVDASTFVLTQEEYAAQQQQQQQQMQQMQEQQMQQQVAAQAAQNAGNRNSNG